MRIAIHATWTARGGIETFTRQLMIELAKNHEILFFVSYWGDRNIYEMPKDIEVVELCLIPKKEEKKKIEKLLIEKKIEVIHVNNTDTVSVALLKIGKRLNIPTIISNHQIPEYGIYKWNNKTNTLKKKILTTFLRNFIWKIALVFIDSYADVVIAPSVFLKKKLISYGCKKRIEIASCGVDTELFTPKPNGECPAIYKKDKKVILYVGRLDFGKRIDVLIKAFKKINTKQCDTQLVICGQDSGAKEALTRLVSFLNLDDQVSIISSLPTQSDNLINLYRYATVFVLPSELETQGIVVLEAMACGLPIVAAGASALPELVTNGENGLLFKEGDVDDCARSLETILLKKDLVEQFGNKSKEFIVSHNIRNVTLRFVDIYQSVKR